MKKHPFDFTSFVLGIWLLAGGGLAIASDYESICNLVWIAPAALGATGLAIAIRAALPSH